MQTRSGQIYNSDKCYMCKEYYAYKQFNNLCSECCSKKYPKKMKKINNTEIDNYHIDKIDEHKLITENTIPEINGLYKYLISNLKKHGGKKKMENHVAEMLFMICFTAKKSISAKQARLIYQLSGTIGKNKTYNKDYKFQHFLAGFIYDYWNIKDKDNGSIAKCYYGQYKPLKKDINDIRIPAALIPISSSEWKRNKTLVDRYKFWYRNIPDELKHCNM